MLPWIAPRWAIQAGEAIGRALGRLGLHVRSDVTEMARGFASLNEAGARDAFRHTLHAVVDPGGQRVSALDRLYLAEDMPVMLLWGANDPIIPAEHGRRAADLIPGSRYVEFEGSGHWPQLDDPERFANTLIDFIETTEPYEFDLERMQQQLRTGPGLTPEI